MSGKRTSCNRAQLVDHRTAEWLSTNNLEAERHWEGFDKQAPVVNFRINKFTANGILNDCSLLLSDAFCKIQSKASIDDDVKVLNDLESKWYNEQ